ncbi:aromatic amino acid lyase [Pseudohalocynthiibacter aestuariivivens]|nr:aromatic amino acid ammonia-lyase [Pseudohalocynthiibacter aestuariivivens]QIE45664.1 aromatic amino acid lyase [Pseudohalocynthiibacter aestuariivivens]
MTIKIDGRTLTINEIARVARDDVAIELTKDAIRRVTECEAFLETLIDEGRPIYGVTTGFGALDGRKVSRADNHAQQVNLLKSHAAAYGPPMSRDTVRAMMVIRVNALATGQTGVHLATLEALVAMLNAGITPHVPLQGSVGACGDLAPLAHMALPLLGLGRARIGCSDWMDGAAVMQQAGIEPPHIAGRDGIALINGTEQTSGIGALALHDASALIELAEEAACLTMEALGAVSDSFDELTALAKPHPGQIATSANMRRLTKDSVSVLPPRPTRLRDALSLRCIPQVHGSTRDAIAHAREAMEMEINAVNDNPIFGVADNLVTSNSGNFHGQRIGEVLDYAANSITSLAVISERRCARLVDENHNGGLPAFLIHPDAAQGRNNGMMIVQYTAASLVAEARTRAVPGTIQSVPTCANTEDHVPMSPLAARRAGDVVDIAQTIVAIECLLAAQAMDLRGIDPAPLLAPVYRTVRDAVPMMVEDRVLGDDLAAARAAVTDYAQTLH